MVSSYQDEESAAKYWSQDDPCSVNHAKPKYKRRIKIRAILKDLKKPVLWLTEQESGKKRKPSAAPRTGSLAEIYSKWLRRDFGSDYGESEYDEEYVDFEDDKVPSFPDFVNENEEQPDSQAENGWPKWGPETGSERETGSKTDDAESRSDSHSESEELTDSQSDNEHFESDSENEQKKDDTNSKEEEKTEDYSPSPESPLNLSSYSALCDKYRRHKNFENPFQVCVSMDFEYHLIYSAWQLAQDTLWHFARQHWPSHQRRYWPESPRTIDFGRTVLEDIFTLPDVSSGSYSKRFPTIACGESWYRVYSSIIGVVALRNMACHPGRTYPGLLDSAICDALDLAIVLKDHERMDALMKLRQDLEDQYRRELEMIEAGESVNEGANGSKWLYHQRLTFQCAKDAFRRGREGKREFPEVIARIAIRDFGAHDPDDPIYVPLPESPNMYAGFYDPAHFLDSELSLLEHGQFQYGTADGDVCSTQPPPGASGCRKCSQSC